MQQKSLNLGSSLTRSEIKKINGGKIKGQGQCHNTIPGLANNCVNGFCRSSGTGACDPNTTYVCNVSLLSYCCCDTAGHCSFKGQCAI